MITGKNANTPPRSAHHPPTEISSVERERLSASQRTDQVPLAIVIDSADKQRGRENDSWVGYGPGLAKGVSGRITRKVSSD